MNIKTLTSYLFENCPNIKYNFINEASFSNKDFTKHDYKYVINVLDNILNNHSITLKEKNDDTNYAIITFNLDNNSKKEIEDFKANINEKSVSDLNKLLLKLFSNSKIDNNNFNINEKSLWTQIFKGDYTGNNSDSSTYGQIFESLVCYLYNKNIDIKNIDINNFEDNKKLYKYIIDWSNEKNVNINDNDFNSWVKSSLYSVKIIQEKIKDTFKKTYIAYHVDGKDFFDKDTKLNDNYKNIINIFKGKKYIKSVLNNNIEYNDIYAGSKKDKWNPADIVLINTNIEYEEYIDKLNSASDGNQLNIFLHNYTISGDIIPISLKKINSNGSLKSVNIDKSINNVNTDSEIKPITIQLGKLYEKNSTSGNFIISNGISSIQIRKQSDNNNLSIEAKLTGNRLARGGKGISKLKSYLGIDKDNSYYYKFDNNKSVLDFFKVNNFVISKNEDEFYNIDKDYEENFKLYKRICFVGFAGLVQKYKEKIKIDLGNPLSNQDAENFYNLLWDSCTKCDGSYYIIS